jgi:hypothetical protein
MVRIIPYLLPYTCYLVIAVLMSSIFLQLTTARAQAAAKREVGISTGATLLRMTDKDLDKRLSDMRSMGATWIRVEFNWATIQPHNAKTYNWKMYDRVVRAASARHIKVLAVLAYTPRWAQEPRCARLVITLAAGEKCNPKSYKTFANFAHTAAARYKNKNVRAWEIWNEPNLSAYWKTAQPKNNAVHADAAAYAKLANAAASQIRRAAPHTLIITGGLAPLWEPKYPKGLRQSDYLAQLLRRLNPALFDAVGIHPYSWPTLPNTAVVHNAFYSVDKGRPKYNLRAIMQKTGFGAKQIWGTEYGASTKGVSRPGQRPDHVTEARQALIISQGVESWYKKSNVGPLMVHADSDQWLHKRKNEGGFGLRRRNGTKKPAYQALQRAAMDL